MKPTQERVITLFHKAGELAGWKPGMGNALVINYLTHFYTLVRNQALEDAAVELEGLFADNGDYISSEIRGMQEPTP